MKSQRGSGMVEFAILAPLLFLVIFGLVDFSRAIQANSTIADAARQGARQAAAAAVSADQPFTGPPSGSCSGVAFTQNANGTGCLTDTAIVATVKTVLKDLTTSVTSFSGTTASNCGTPPAGTAYVCIAPSESGTASTYTSCTDAQTKLGRDPTPGDAGMGTRKEEWSAKSFASGRCFLVEVTVKYAFKPWTPVISSIIGSGIQLASSTSTVAEY